MLCHILLFVTPWTLHSMEFSRPEYWNGYPLPSSGDLPYPGIKPRSPTLQADSSVAEPLPKLKNTGMKPIPSLAHLPNSGIESGSPALHVDSLPAELPGNLNIHRG